QWVQAHKNSSLMSIGGEGGTHRRRRSVPTSLRWVRAARNRARFGRATTREGGQAGGKEGGRAGGVLSVECLSAALSTARAPAVTSLRGAGVASESGRDLLSTNFSMRLTIG